MLDDGRPEIVAIVFIVGRGRGFVKAENLCAQDGLQCIQFNQMRHRVSVRLPEDLGCTRATIEGKARTRDADLSQTRRRVEWTEIHVVAQRLFAAINAIADSGFIVASGNRADHHHPWAHEVSKRITAPALICEAVLAQAAFQHLEHLQTLARVDEDRQPDSPICALFA